jgi:hypothetical protein
MKQCNKCKVEKPLTEFSNHKATKDRKQGSCKKCVKIMFYEWKEKNAKRFKQLRKKNQKLNPERYQSYIDKIIKKTGKGIYEYKYRWLSLYIGEGQMYIRKTRHKCIEGKYGGKTSYTQISKLIKERNLNSKYLSFNVLEYEDDKSIRLEKETQYRRELKPYINPL